MGHTRRARSVRPRNRWPEFASMGYHGFVMASLLADLITFVNRLSGF
jgi:hypothetical protein